MEKKYLAKLPCQNKLIFKYMICKSAAWQVTFGAMIEFPPGNLVVIGSNLLCHESFFYKSLTHRNAHEVRVFNL